MNWGSPRDHENVASTEQANRKRAYFQSSAARDRRFSAFLFFPAPAHAKAKVKKSGDPSPHSNLDIAQTGQEASVID